MDENTMDFDGCCFYSNEIWTSMKAHFNLTLSSASKAWFRDGNDARGVAFYNNYTPEGLSVVTGIGIVSNGMFDVTIHGNQLHVYIAPLVSDKFSAHLVCINAANYSGGDVQMPYEDDAVHSNDTCYIGERINVTWTSIELQEGIIYEDFGEIPPIYTDR